jgi:hypothetical protein
VLLGWREAFPLAGQPRSLITAVIIVIVVGIAAAAAATARVSDRRSSALRWLFDIHL